MFCQMCFWAKVTKLIVALLSTVEDIKFPNNGRSQTKICMTGFQVSGNARTTYDFPAFDGSQGLEQ